MKDKFSFSVCVTHAQYFGKPILCDAGHASSGVEEDVLSKLFLYIHKEMQVFLQMATVGCLQHIGCLQTTTVSAAVPWRRRTGMYSPLTFFTFVLTYWLIHLLLYFNLPTKLLTYRDVYTSYYQWVPPFLIASACLFYLPRWGPENSQKGFFFGSNWLWLDIFCWLWYSIRSIWLSLEDGLMNYFSTGTRER